MAKKRSRFREKEEEIGQRIRRGRTLRDWSLNRLAGQIGVSYQQLQKYEKGVNRISASMLREISQILKLPLEFFFEESEDFCGHSFAFDELQTALQIHAIEDKERKSLILKLVKQFTIQG